MLLEAVLAATVAGSVSAVVVLAVAPALYRRFGPDPRVWEAKSTAASRAEAAEAQVAAVLDLVGAFAREDLPAMLAGRPPRQLASRGASAAVTAVHDLLGSAGALVAGEMSGLRARLHQERVARAGLQQHTDGWLTYLTSKMTEHHTALAAVIDALAHEREPVLARPLEMELRGGEGLFEDFARIMASTLGTAWDAALSLDTRRGHADTAAPAEVFVLLARRMHSLIRQTIGAVEELERQEEDPLVLNGLFAVDQLVTRLLRALEAQAVLGGQSARRTARPVLVATTLRQAVAATEDYARVRVQPGVPNLSLAGFAAPDIANLLSELCENATRFSRPGVTASLRADHTPTGLTIAVEDRGMGMDDDLLRQYNGLLAAPHDVDVRTLFSSERIGLLIVARYAARHRIGVDLRRNSHGGTTAQVLVPYALISAAEPTEAAASATERVGQDLPTRAAALPAVATGMPAVAGGLAAAGAGVTPTPERPAVHPAAGAPGGGRPALPRRQRQPTPAPAPVGAAQGAADDPGTPRPDRFAQFIGGANAQSARPGPPAHPV